MCVQNAVALAKGVPLSCLRHRHAVAMRKYALDTLLRVGQPPSRERLRCDAVDCREPKTRYQRWVCCDVCGRWLHFACCNIKRKPRSAYICVICCAQYNWCIRRGLDIKTTLMYIGDRVLCCQVVRCLAWCRWLDSRITLMYIGDRVLYCQFVRCLAWCKWLDIRITWMYVGDRVMYCQFVSCLAWCRWLDIRTTLMYIGDRVLCCQFVRCLAWCGWLDIRITLMYIGDTWQSLVLSVCEMSSLL